MPTFEDTDATVLIVCFGLLESWWKARTKKWNRG